MKDHLRVFRAEAGLTQAQLTERLAVSRQAVKALKIERLDPSLDLACRTSVMFGRPVEDIFEKNRTIAYIENIARSKEPVRFHQ